MKRHTDEEVQQTITLREKGKYSFAQLSRMTGIPATTIRNWCTGLLDIAKSDTLIATNERKRQELRSSEINTVAHFDISDKITSKILAALLYWCEGSKYPSSVAVTMVNSDHELLRTFVTLLRRAFPLDESKFKIHVQIHTTHDFKKIKKYWSNILQIPQSQFIKPTTTQPRGGKHRKQYFGTCTVKYHDYRILLKLMGIYEAFAKKV